MDSEKSAEEQKKELHLLIDSSTNNLVKNLSNIFDALKFTQGNVQSSGNIEINENMDSISNEINTLLNIVNKMKFREIRLKEAGQMNDMNNNHNKIIVDSLKKLTDIHENIENYLMETKKSYIATMAKYICSKQNNQ